MRHALSTDLDECLFQTAAVTLVRAVTECLGNGRSESSPISVRVKSYEASHVLLETSATVVLR